VRALAVGLALALGGCAVLTPRLEVPAAARAVVIAPHPDDETLAAGGLIQRILATGGRVRVIVVTEGDGYLEAAAALSGHPTPSALDYRALGAIRAAELREATQKLGVPDADVVRLQEPDGGISELWTDHWSSKRPYWSPHSGRGPFAGDRLYARPRRHPSRPRVHRPLRRSGGRLPAEASPDAHVRDPRRRVAAALR
jgi:LmbE family N-acetylglucosaminyl deacetylase